MGFSLFKKKKNNSSTSNPPSSPQNDQNNYSTSPGNSFNSKSNKPFKSKSSSSTFSRLFRSQPASSTLDRKLTDVTQPSSNNSNLNSNNSDLRDPNFPRRRTSSTPPQSSSSKLNLESLNRWQGSSVSLGLLDHEIPRESSSSSSMFESTISSIGPLSGSRLRTCIDASAFEDDNSEIESLSHHHSRLGSSGTTNDSEMKEKRLSRFFSGGPKRRTSSVAGSTMFMGEKESRMSEDSAAGFEVKSFRVVHRVQEGPSSSTYTSPYDNPSSQLTTTTTTTSPPLSPTLSDPSSTRAKSYTTQDFRIPPSIATSESERSPSPTMSAEAFRLATARSRSSTSINLMSNGSSEEISERPRFEPRRSSLLIDSISIHSPFNESKKPEFAPSTSSSNSRINNLNQKIRPSSLYAPSTLPQEIRFSKQEASSRNFIDPATSSSPSLLAPAVRQRSPGLILERPPTAWRNSSADFSTLSKSSQQKTKRWGESDSSDEEDDVPLARLKAASVSDLTLAVKGLGLEGSRMEMESEQEVLCASPVQESSEEKEDRERLSETVKSVSPRSTSFGLGQPSRRTQRRSISTLAFSTSPILNNFPPSSSPSQSPIMLGHRSYSNPISPQISSGFTVLDSSLPISSPSTSASVSPVFDQRHSSSSVSTSDSGTSSLLHTPNDQSPGVSTVGVKEVSLTPPTSERAVKFDVQSLSNSNESERKWNNRLSALQPLPGKSSMSSGSSFNNSSRTLSHVPSEPELKSTRRSSMFAEPSINPSVKKGDVFDRMKARHKAETKKAIALGKDLNGPGDIVDESEEEDDDTPLSGLGAPGRQRASMYFDQSPQFFPQQQQQQQQYQQQPLQAQQLQQHQQQFYNSSPAFYSCPPGVDPYLYASLPMDQRMALDARANQMMQMMAGYSLQAKAESQGGWDSGSNASGGSSEIGVPDNAGGGMYNVPRNRSSMMSMSGSMISGMNGMAGGGMNGMGYGYGTQYSGNPFMPGGSRLPPFAPSIATSQPFFQPLPQQQYQPQQFQQQQFQSVEQQQQQQQQQFQPQFQPNFYGNPYASSSDVGVSRSNVGAGGVGGTGGKVKRTKVPSSIGTGRKN